MHSISISQVDALFVNGGYPIEFVLYFPGGIPTRTLRTALRRLSNTFWPLFGRYRDGAILRSTRYVEDDYFLETVGDGEFDTTLDAMGIRETFKDTNSPAVDALFFMSVVQFGNGTVLVPRMQHLVGDGYSYFYFLSVLAILSKPSSLPFRGQVIRFLAAPRLPRTLLRDYHFTRTDIEARPVDPDCTIRLERIPRQQVEQEITRINSESGAGGSANDFLSAMVVREAARRQPSGTREHFSLTTPVDVRRGIKQLGPKFLGNGILLHRQRFSMDELENTDVATLALRLRQAAPRISAQRYGDYLAALEAEIASQPTCCLGPYDPDQGCLVTNLSRMPIQRLDFGAGSPGLVMPITIGRNSVAMLADREDFLLRFAD